MAVTPSPMETLFQEVEIAIAVRLYFLAIIVSLSYPRYMRCAYFCEGGNKRTSI